MRQKDHEMSATIAVDRDIFTLINTFEVEPRNQQALIDELANVTATHTRFLPGFIGASVHRSLDGHYVVNYVQWQSKLHFEAMLGNPAMKDHLSRVSALSISITPRLYAVAYVESI